MKDYKKGILYSAYFVVFLFLILLIRLFQIQLLKGNEYLKLSESNRLRVINIPAPRGIIFDRNGIPLVKNSPFFCASIIPGEFSKDRIGLLAELLGIKPEKIHDTLNRKDISLFSPIKIKEGLSFDEVSYIEARRSDIPGLIIEVEVSREYIYGDIGAHIIGYLGKPSLEQLKDPSYKNISADIFIGQWGVEKIFDDILRGIPGKRIIEVNAIGRELRLLDETLPIKGKDIYLSIDMDVQKEIEEMLVGKAGAVVAIKPKTGEILSLVSKPSFDPNMFTKGLEYEKWLTIINDKKKPMLNRALQSQYPPGSTFKIITAIAGLEEGVINSTLKVECNGHITYGKWRFGCWQKNGHGVLSLHRAIVESCDVYFYEVGKRLGIDKIHDYALKLGLGEKTGIELPGERQGLIPDTKWKMEKRKSPWFLGETFNSAIGQGYVSVTPLQMAVLTSVVANNGSLYKPTIIKNDKPTILNKVKLKEETLELIKKGLYGVVNESSGTGWAARSSIVAICGKTGTAQVISKRDGSIYQSGSFRDHAWFVAFAPLENPEIAMSIIVEHGGHGGGAAAPIAKRAIETYIMKQKSNNVSKNNISIESGVKDIRSDKE